MIDWRVEDSPRRIVDSLVRGGGWVHTAQSVFGVYDKDRIAVALQPLPYAGVYLETSAYIPRYAKTLEKWGGGGK